MKANKQSRTVFLLSGGHVTVDITGNPLLCSSGERALVEEMLTHMEAYEAARRAEREEINNEHALVSAAVKDAPRAADFPGLSPYPAGTWLILNWEMTRILASGETLEAAMSRAGIAPGLTTESGKKPVAFQVPPAHFCGAASLVSPGEGTGT